MKRFAILLVAFLALGASFARAQVMPSSISVKKGVFYDDSGNAINPSVLASIIGDEIYNETYVGASKQYKAGKNLIIWGAVGAGVGFVTYAVALASYVAKYPKLDPTQPSTWPIDSSLSLAAGGLVVGALGSACLAAGIPLNVIGKSRMNWIASDYNEKHSNVSLNLTGSQAGYGLGLALRF